MDYSNTLNLPQTDFPMRGNLPKKEPEILKYWEDNDIYQAVLDKTSGQEQFILHDGPPYANGNIHLGHTLNKILKDMIIKYKSMSGYNSPYIPGWDTHGLPIELQAIKALGLNRHEVDPIVFRHKCKEFALKYVDLQREQFKRLGVRAKWDNPYITLYPHFEARQVEVFGEMAKKGYIFKGLKPVYWCSHCETALAEAEVEYADKKSSSIYVKFKLIDGKGLLAEDKCYFVIWTTTPWTIPSNEAISVHPDYVYIKAEINGEFYVLAKELADNFAEAVGAEGYEIRQEFSGKDLEYMVCQHPLLDRESIVIVGEHVTLEQGTGCVHTAPGHGQEDFEVCRKYNMPVISPINAQGVCTQEIPRYEGLKYSEINKQVIEDLQEVGALLKLGSITHSYPHCWRCKQPIIFRATEQWFASIEGFRQKALDSIAEVRWIPAWGEERIHNMIADRGDWCISRQRLWGVPIPIFYCRECGKEIINDETIAKIRDLFAEFGSDVWFAREAADLVPEGLTCPECGCREFRKEKDIMDVWFDSGSSHFAVLEQPAVWPELRWPADMYLEGSDQYRGWFNSSLSTSVAVRGTAPYRQVLTHGFLVDEKGIKQSKSLGNTVDPLKVIDQMGADILRLWVASADYRSDLAVSNNILKQISDSYRKIRNTCRFLLGNLSDFDLAADMAAKEDMHEIDLWAMDRLQRLTDKVLKAYNDYEFHVIYHAIHNFCAVDMSAFYLDIVKDRLYTNLPQSKDRKAAQTVMYRILDNLVRMLTPILSFTMEEVWKYMPKPDDGIWSPQLLSLPQVDSDYINEDLAAKWQKIQKIREEIARALEIARQDKIIGHSLDAVVKLSVSGEWKPFVGSIVSDLAEICIVSEVEMSDAELTGENIFTSEEIPGFKVAVAQSPYEKCERCWNYRESVVHSPEHICDRCASILKQM